MTMSADDAKPEALLEVERLTPRFVAAMNRLDAAARHETEQAALEPALVELVRLRASQMNGCDYCIDLHSRDAADTGVSDARILALREWRESPLFTDRERSALAFTESVSRHLGEDPDGAMAGLRSEFSEGEAAGLLSAIVMINAWNTLAVSSRAWSP